MPVHDHDLNVRGTQTPKSGRSKTPEDNVLTHGGQKIYTDLATDAQMAPGTVGPEGGSIGQNNMQPYLGLHYILCVSGTYPSRS
jgi:microcystin-dependent protein